MANILSRTAVPHSRGRVRPIHMANQALPLCPLPRGFRSTQMAQIQRLRRHDFDRHLLLCDNDPVHCTL